MYPHDRKWGSEPQNLHRIVATGYVTACRIVMPITKGTERGGRQPKYHKLKFPGYDRAWLDRLMFKWSLFFWNLAKRRQ